MDYFETVENLEHLSKSSIEIAYMSDEHFRTTYFGCKLQKTDVINDVVQRFRLCRDEQRRNKLMTGADGS